MKRTLLKLQNVNVFYGCIHALKNVSFELREGEILTLIGANGAGKSTTLRTISGLLPPKSGEIYFEERLIIKRQAHEIVKMGIAQVPEGRGIFLNLTVEENLDLGAWTENKNHYKKNLEYVFSLLPRLKERQKQMGGTLSGGELQMLAIGRALMAKPKVLLLDEPSLGLAPKLIETILEIIQKIHREGTSIVLVEQNALQALNIAHYGVVLETGTVACFGPAKELMQSKQIKEAYLGG